MFYAPFQLFAHTSACSEEAVKKSGNPNVMMKNPSDMENQVFLKAKTRVSVLFYAIGYLGMTRDLRVCHANTDTQFDRVGSNHYTACLYPTHIEECF